MLKAVLFDLDGTLLPMNEDQFTNGYLGMLCKKLAPYGYKSEELVKVIWAGFKAMIKNDGSQTNEQAFWHCFVDIYGKDKLKDASLFTNFYRNEFKQAKVFCGENPKARGVIDFVKAQELKLILASNPVFPRCAMINRLNYINLNEEDFDYITSYETSHYSKPNPKFYQEILDQNHLIADEVIFFGNSETEDIAPATEIGIKSFLVGDKGIKFEEINEVIQTMLEK